MGVPAATGRGEGVHPPGSSATPGDTGGLAAEPPGRAAGPPTRRGNPPAWASPALGAAGADPAPPVCAGVQGVGTRVCKGRCARLVA